jgi:hypothetical protein
VSAQTVGAGKTFLHLQAGYPGIFASLLAGQGGMDIGGKFGFVYGSEAGVGAAAVGLRLQGLLRFLLTEINDVKLGLEIEPGIYTYFPTGGVLFGLVIPVKFTVGIPITSAIAVHAGADLPIQINITNGFGMAIPILLGGGVEYFLNDSMSVNARLRLGPSIIISGGGGGVGGGGAGVIFGLDALVGFAMRL